MHTSSRALASGLWLPRRPKSMILACSLLLPHWLRRWTRNPWPRAAYIPPSRGCVKCPCRSPSGSRDTCTKRGMLGATCRRTWRRTCAVSCTTPLRPESCVQNARTPYVLSAVRSFYLAAQSSQKAGVWNLVLESCPHDSDQCSSSAVVLLF